ncbi:hypothetical protein CDAR_196021 [Caerostris darwini]|uniref:Uncharacterized protein n=1 Tax=Caerostris darwini TaxID=1538125 RepID=A0AAV4MGY7_9ARAC|nr:hypothetical protein CDAR_196021 [Caerostris darwini]
MNKRTRDKQNRGHQIVSPNTLSLHITSAPSRHLRPEKERLLSSQPPLTTRPRPDPSVPSNQRTGKQRSPYAQARYLGASFISYQGFHLERLHW